MKKENHLDKNIKKWFAVYTKPRTEKKVKEQLDEYGYESYLPLKKEYRQWKDRIKKVEVPLFSSYIFVKVNHKQYYEIPKLIRGFYKYVSVGGEKISVREKEIAVIKQLLDFNSEKIITSSESFRLNDTVEIKTGSLKGLKGKLVEFRGLYKIAVKIETLNTNLLVEITKDTVKKTK